MTKYGRRRPELGHVHDSKGGQPLRSEPALVIAVSATGKSLGCDVTGRRTSTSAVSWGCGRSIGLSTARRGSGHGACPGLGAGAYAGSATEVLSSTGRAARTQGQVINAQTPATTAISTTT